MKSLKITTTIHMAALSVNSKIAPPDRKLGELKSMRTVEITEIPDEVADHEVLRAWEQTADLTANLSNDFQYSRHSFTFSEIGNGKMITA